MKRGDKFDREIELFVEDCIHCGIHFAVPSDFLERRRKDHKTFYCPNGHSMYFSGKNKEEILTRKLEEAEACCDIYKNRERRREYQKRYYKGQLTRLKKGEGSASYVEVSDE